MWLSLVEHLVRDEGVVGSNPITPTNLLNGLVKSRFSLPFIPPIKQPVLLRLTRLAAKKKKESPAIEQQDMIRIVRR